MTCPSCSAEMKAVVLGRRLGSTLEIDLCSTCRAFWFDRYEDLQLSPAATLKLFGIITDKADARAIPLAHPLRCPRCRAQLALTHDLQRSTRFQYWRCVQEHGRLMTYVDFLRAKDFVRPLSPRQLAELRDNVQIINCSNCAAPIDLATDSACRHCGSPVSMLDVKHMAHTIEQLRVAAAAGSAAPVAAVLRATSDGEDVTDLDALLRAVKERRGDSSLGLVEAGLGLIGMLIRKI